MENQTINNDKTWQDRDLTFVELIRQDYTNCSFTGGTVDGHDVDTLYIQLKKDGFVTTQLLLRPDEVAALAWIASGLLFSELIDKV